MSKKDVSKHKKLYDDIYNLIKDENELTEEEKLITDKKICITGNVDSGKSSFVGTLTSNILDNGRGLTRNIVARHDHEIKSGRTSDISSQIIKFENGKTATLIDLCGHEKYFTTTASGISGLHPDYAIVIISPNRGVKLMTKQHFRMIMSYNIPTCFIITHVDVAEEKSCQETIEQIQKLCKTYKRTVDFVNSYEHYHSIKNAIKILEKNNIDITNTINISDEKITNIKDSEMNDIKCLYQFKNDKIKFFQQIKNTLDLSKDKQSIIPALFISNVDGYCLDVIKNVLMKLKTRDYWKNDTNSTIVKFFRKKLYEKKLREFKNIHPNKELSEKDITNFKNVGFPDKHYGTTLYIEASYKVEGIGTVLAILCRGDSIEVNQQLYLGPMRNHGNKFVPIKIKSIHNDDRTPITKLQHHHFGCIAIKSMDSKIDIKKRDIKKGMVIISNLDKIVNVGYRFKASVSVLNSHSATLKHGYSPVIHIGTIKQCAKMVLHDEKDIIDNISYDKKVKAGETEEVLFKFIFNPEYMEKGTVFVFRSGEIHGVGMITEIISIKDDPHARPEPSKKMMRKLLLGRNYEKKHKTNTIII
jgi:GTPase